MRKSNGLWTAVLAAGLAASLPVAPTWAADPFVLRSPAFADGAMLDVTAAGTGSPNCAGGNVSPPFAWSGAPPETKSFAVLMADVDGRAGLGVSHLVVYGIPATTAGVASGALGTPTGMVAGRNTRGGGGYLGPCPAPGTGAHHYVFQVIATDLPPDALAPGLSRDALLAALDGHAKAGASLVGLFGGARRD